MAVSQSGRQADNDLGGLVYIRFSVVNEGRTVLYPNAIGFLTGITSDQIFYLNTALSNQLHCILDA